MPRLRLASGGAFVLAALASGCEPSPEPRAEPAPGDDVPSRIVSLVPSVTGMIVELGEGHRLVGRTDYDRDPALDGLPSVGGGLNPSLERLVSLGPDLVVRFEGISDTDTPARLDELGVRHLGVRTDRIGDVRDILVQLGTILDREARADSLVAAIDADLGRVRQVTRALPTVRAAFVLGGNPPWVAGPDTFIDELIEQAGGVNVFADLELRYGGVSPETFRARAPEVILLGPGTALDPELVGGARVVTLPATVEQPGADLGAAAWAVAEALHPEIVR